MLILPTQRVIFVFSPAVEKTLEHAFKSRGLDRLDSWHLLEIATDPIYEGRGTIIPLHIEIDRKSVV